MTKNNFNQNPNLSFEFASSNGEVKPLTFTNPVKIIVANTIEEVLPSFRQIQEAVDNGFYAAGYVSYEAAPAFDEAFKVNSKQMMPLLWFGIFEEPQNQTLSSSGSYEHSKWLPNVTLDEYESAITAIKNFIESGDTYQTNYTIRLHSQFKGDDLSFFTKLKKAQSSNYCAYINTGDHSILSASPELFFHLEGNQITTRPMKGTIARGLTLEQDEKNAKWLYDSEKNRAENVMIVDLLRNDLNFMADQGTVQVPKLFEIEQYPTVHQMTSTITAEVSPKLSFYDIFKALFPCGSITGAPKISTMEIISNLEHEPRDVYCGAIGYITPQKEAIFNVPIRTVIINQQTGQATYGVGGGITWDSTSKGEYEEVITKASLLETDRPDFELLESLLLEDGDIFLLEEHLTRLQNSAKYFNFSLNSAEVKNSLHAFSKQHTTGAYKLRLLLEKTGKVVLESQPIKQSKAPFVVALADTPIDKKDVFYYHKTTNRSNYSQFQEKNQSVFDVLLWNEDGHLTEFTNGNVVLEIGGELLTPPIQSGLLAGTFREQLLNEGKIREKILTLEEVKSCSKIWFINSVRKWIQVELV